MQIAVKGIQRGVEAMKNRSVGWVVLAAFLAGLSLGVLYEDVNNARLKNTIYMSDKMIKLLRQECGI